jgi:hypothetical protein
MGEGVVIAIHFFPSVQTARPPHLPGQATNRRLATSPLLTCHRLVR